LKSQELGLLIVLYATHFKRKIFSSSLHDISAFRCKMNESEQTSRPFNHIDNLDDRRTPGNKDLDMIALE